jgi:NDP-sugar pyrophosphorylase family protein
MAEMPTVALLAGGLARRMLPATQSIAKSMLPVDGEPFLAHQLRLLRNQGIHEVVLCCGHLERQLRDFAGNGSRWGCRIRYSQDGPQPLGTGGALRKALPLLGESFMVMYGDSYLPTPFEAVWNRFIVSGKQGLMTVFENAGRWDTSNVEFQNGRLLDYSKSMASPRMRHIDYGLSCLSALALAPWPDGSRFDLSEVMQLLLQNGQLDGYAVNERFYEIGSVRGYAETDAMLHRQRAVTLPHQQQSSKGKS